MSSLAAVILFFILWLIIGIIYAHRLYEHPMYQEILNNDDWQNDQEILDQIDQYGMVYILLDLFMILPVIIIVYPFK